MRSSRFCKMILNRLGQYDSELNVWRGKFPGNSDHVMRLIKIFDYFGRPTDLAKIHLISPKQDLYLTYPAQQLRRYLFGWTKRKIFLFPNQKSEVIYGIGMVSSVVYHTLQIQRENFRLFTMHFRSPITHAIFNETFHFSPEDKNSLWGIFHDSLIDHEKQGKGFIRALHEEEDRLKSFSAG